MLTAQQVVQQVHGLTREELNVFVHRGWVKPDWPVQSVTASVTETHEVYLEIDVARLRLIQEMRIDLEFDDEAVSTLLSLLDQVHTLRAELRVTALALAEQPDDVRQGVLQAMKRLRSGRVD